VVTTYRQIVIGLIAFTLAVYLAAAFRLRLFGIGDKGLLL
jgi:hypothetical protein